jgi:hypothetical protein
MGDSNQHPTSPANQFIHTVSSVKTKPTKATQNKHNMKTKIQILVAAALGVLTLGGLTKTHAGYNVLSPYSLTPMEVNPLSGTFNAFEGGFTAYSGTLYTWGDSSFGSYGYFTTNIATGDATLVNYQHLNGNGYGDPFGIYVPTSGTFYAGTYNDNGTGGLYGYDGKTPWNFVGPFGSPYSADSSKAYGNLVFIAGLTGTWSGTYGQNTNIAVYPHASGTNTYQVIISGTGNSSCVALDDSGNVYYASYSDTISPKTTSLLRWSSTDVANAFSNGSALTVSAATVLTDLPVDAAGANGLAVDEGGNAFFTVNGGSGAGIYVWTSTSGTGHGANYTKVADLTSGWAGFLDTEGNVLNGGTLIADSTDFSNDYYIITYGGSAPAAVKAARKTTSAAAPITLNAEQSAYVQTLRDKYKANPKSLTNRELKIVIGGSNRFILTGTASAK